MILGERHQRPEGRELFYEIVKTLLERDESVLVALEIPAERQAELDKAFAGKRSLQNIASPIIETPSFIRMLKKLRALGVQSGKLKVVAIDSLSGDRDLKMAEKIKAEMSGGRWDRAVVLVGNIHALKVIPWAGEFASGGMKLAGILDARMDVASFVQGYADTCSAASSTAAFYPIDHDRAAEKILRLWQGMNTTVLTGQMPEKLGAVDGVVEWSCGLPPAIEMAKKAQAASL